MTKDWHPVRTGDDDLPGGSVPIPQLSGRPTFVGIDTATGPDWSAEVVCSKAPDGSIVVESVHTYKQTIDGKDHQPA